MEPKEMSVEEATKENIKLAKAIASRHKKRTGNVNQLGSVEKVVMELLPDILEELEK